MKLLKISLIFSSLFLSACSSTFANSINDDGRILIHADSEGMEAFGDVLNGLVNNTKTPPEIESSHYQLRKIQTQLRVLPKTKEAK